MNSNLHKENLLMINVKHKINKIYPFEVPAF